MALLYLFGVRQQSSQILRLSGIGVRQKSYQKLILSRLETVQDFSIKLGKGIKPRMHILEINIFSLNHVIVRPTKIMNNLLKDGKIMTVKVIFQQPKSTESLISFL